VPVHLDRLWDSIFSFRGGKFFGKRPRHVPYPVTVSFAKPLPSTATSDEVRSEILKLASRAAELRKGPEDLLHRKLIRTARRNWKRLAMADSSGRELTFGEVLTGSVLVGDWLRAHCANDKMLGVLLPPSSGGALVNAGATLCGKTPVNLNF